jgi:hypothetical protein
MTYLLPSRFALGPQSTIHHNNVSVGSHPLGRERAHQCPRRGRNARFSGTAERRVTPSVHRIRRKKIRSGSWRRACWGRGVARMMPLNQRSSGQHRHQHLKMPGAAATLLVSIWIPRVRCGHGRVPVRAAAARSCSGHAESPAIRSVRKPRRMSSFCASEA